MYACISAASLPRARQQKKWGKVGSGKAGRAWRGVAWVGLVPSVRRSRFALLSCLGPGCARQKQRKTKKRHLNLWRRYAPYLYGNLEGHLRWCSLKHCRTVAEATKETGLFGTAAACAPIQPTLVLPPLDFSFMLGLSEYVVKLSSTE